jgi:hypothetical protein
MKRSTVLCLGLIGLAGTAHAQVRRTPAPAAARKDRAMRATGTFDVEIKPLDFHSAAEPSLGRMAIAKQLHGELTGTSVGEMLTAGTDTKGSGAYVAVERVTGTLGGRTGSFAMHHVGIMTRGAPSLTIHVVPDSGTGQLTGIAGTFTIKNDAGKHSYELDYTLPDPT